MISLDHLYSMMKDALEFFGLKWSAMNQVQVEIKGSGITFIYDDMQITYKDKNA